ncbi:MAG: hypothetical protein O9295_22380 [Microcystis sp. LE18-22.4A]|nr:hypothetical protein [Microcystis sp. LE18-22.4A]
MSKSQESGDRSQEIAFIYSPHFPTSPLPHFPTSQFIIYNS